MSAIVQHLPLPSPAGVAAPHLPVPAAPAAHRRPWLLTCLLVHAVAAALATAAAAARVARPGDALGWTLAFDGLTFAVLCGRSFYRFRLRASWLEDLGRVLAATTTAATVIVTLRALLAPAPMLAGGTVRLWVFVSAYLAVAQLGLSLGTRRARTAVPGGVLNTLVIGSDPVGQLVARRLLERPQLGLRPVGFLDCRPAGRHEEPPVPLLGSPDELERHVTLHGVGHVVVAFCDAPPSAMLELVRRCRALGVGVSVVPRLYEQVTRRVEVDHLGGLPLLQVHQADPRGWQFAVKYFLDRVVAAMALLVLAPLLAAVALAVKLTSPGPVLYRQRRVGLDGQEFEILKFRTMAEAPHDSVEPGELAAVAMLHERCQDVVDRRTPLGRWLRRFSIDELPQLINVLKGEMSFIGPRPERPSLVRTFERHVYRYGDRHRVKSGLTGWAQVHGLRGCTSLADRIEWDNYYIENWSPWLDLRIALMTIPALVSGRGAE